MKLIIMKKSLNKLILFCVVIRMGKKTKCQEVRNVQFFFFLYIYIFYEIRLDNTRKQEEKIKMIRFQTHDSNRRRA